MNKKKNIENVASNNGQFFGFDYSIEEAEIILLPIPWNLTCSFRDMTIHAPEKMIELSGQLDFFNPQFPDMEIPKTLTFKNNLDTIKKLSSDNRPLAIDIIDALEKGDEKNALIEKNTPIINQACQNLHSLTYETCLRFIEQNKKVIIIGGDHSVPFGLLKALNEKHESFSILQIDAHADLRSAYMGFEYSHASAMQNALKLKKLSSITQVGIRDLCKTEYECIQNNPKINCFFDFEINQTLSKGESWDSLCNAIINSLGKNVYLSIDIDGLSPENCPSTGTPVPGGLSYQQITQLLDQLQQSEKNIIGADLCEIAYNLNNEFDCIIGTHLLWKTINLSKN